MPGNGGGRPTKSRPRNKVHAPVNRNERSKSRHLRLVHPIGDVEAIREVTLAAAAFGHNAAAFGARPDLLDAAALEELARWADRLGRRFRQVVA